MVAWENSPHLATLPLVSPPNHVWETSAEIPYWWGITTQIGVVLLIGRAEWEIWFNQSEALPRSEALWCYHPNETSSAVLWHGTVGLVCQSNVLVSGWNPLVWPFKPNFFCGTFSRYHFKIFFERSKETIYFVFSILESEERLTMDFQGARDLCPDWLLYPKFRNFGQKKKRYYMRDTTWPLVGTKFQSSSVEKYFTSERTKREISYLEAAM